MKTPQRLNALLLAAALVLVQVCTGYSVALANASNLPAVTAADGCCGGGGTKPDCGAAQIPAAAFDACSRNCVQGQDVADSDFALPASAAFACAGPFSTAQAVFPSDPIRAGALPRAANTTPLIYQFQRLLN